MYIEQDYDQFVAVLLSKKHICEIMSTWPKLVKNKNATRDKGIVIWEWIAG